ncbi:MAG TPA: sulfotransferase, partial [Methylomirabilota bacterium]|nr:sulfotransferase [Methylomirabilota bacterium]
MIDPLGDHLIFLISQPRAGSTLLQRVLAGHPEIFATAEPWLMLHPLYALRTEGLTAEYDAGQARAALKDFCENLPRGEESYVEAVRAFGVALYNQALAPSGRSRFLDKTPRYYLVCDELRRAFPRAKFVLLLRNPLAVLASILTTWVKQDWPRLDRHRLDLVRAPGLLAEAMTRFGDQAHVVRYEDLVDAPEATVRRLCDHLGLEFQARMIDYGANPRPRGRMGDAVGIHRHQRPVTESRDRWIEVLRGPRERLLAEHYLDALDDAVLAKLGYPKEELRARLCSRAVREGAVRPAWVAHAAAFFGGAESVPGQGPTSAPVNRAHSEKARDCWNMARMEDAMFQRVFTSAAINAISEEEKRAAWERSARQSANLVLEGLPARADWHVLEIGCGVGRIIKPLRERFARVDGVDISERMIEFARQYLADARGHGRVMVNSGCDLADLPDHDYDLVYSMIVFQHIRSASVVRSYLREVRRVLKPGGYFRLKVYRARPGLGRADEEAVPGVQYGFEGNGYTEEELRALLVEAGFTIDTLETRLNWIWTTARNPVLNDAATGSGRTSSTVLSENPAPSPASAVPPGETRNAASPRSLAEDFIAEADRHFRNGDLTNARAWLDRALDVDRPRADVLLARANLDVQLGELPAAREALARAVELKPDDVSLLVPLACVSLSVGDVTGFESALGRAMQIAPDDPNVRRAFADANFQCGRWAEAARAYFQLLQTWPDDTGLLLPLGVCLARAGEADAAGEAFRRVLALQPDHALARENLAALSGPTRPQTMSSSPEAVHTHPVPAAESHVPSRYFQPPAGATERAISVRPRRVLGAAQSAWQALKGYSIRHTGEGLTAVAAILEHILKNKLRCSWKRNERFWAQTLVLPVECELAHAASGRFFDDLKPSALVDLGAEFAEAEAPRAADIAEYTRRLREGADLGAPLYVTGALLKHLSSAAVVEPGAIYMVDGARRLTASALCHRRTVRVWLLLHESEFAEWVAPAEREALRRRLAALRWFESYQSIPLLGLKGQRTLRRFELMPLEWLRDAVVMDFGCNTGQACLKAAQAGARVVMGVEGMPDTCEAAREIARLVGLANVRYAQVDFNAPDFEGQIDAAWPEPVDYAFFFSVYRTKELTQRERLFRYVLRKARKGVFFEGHAAPRIDTLEYYEWLFDCFEVKGRFLGHSEGELRPLFFIDVTADAGGSVAPVSRPAAVAGDRVAEPAGCAVAGVPEPTSLRPLAREAERGSSVPEVTGSGRGDGLLVAGSGAGTRSEDGALSAGEGGRASGPGVCRVEASAGSSAAPLVSAIVSTYASERFMEGRLRDLLAQTLGDRLEIIVVDSASPENEGAIVKRFAERHPNIRYLRTEKRETIYQAWNRACRIARGRYLTNANTDDRLRPDALERLARELDEHPEVAVVYGDFFITNSENQEFHRHIRTGYSRKPDYQPGIMRDGCHMGPQPMWRRSLHDEIGWFDETLVAAGDYDFWCRVALKHPLRHVPEFLGLYLHNAAGICNGDTRRTEAETAAVRRRYQRHFPKPPPDLPRGVFHREPSRPGRYVNIGMVTFNRLDFTRRAIEALVRHTDFPYVLTVVDNASTDGTREELRRLREQGVITNL